MLQPGHLVRCPCFWPRFPAHFTLEQGYLVPGASDILRVLYVGGAVTGDAGWLFCVEVIGPPTSPPRSPGRRPPSGWLPAWAVLRLRAPGPLMRTAWDGRRYPLAAWINYYGEDLGLRCWERAPC